MDETGKQAGTDPTQVGTHQRESSGWKIPFFTIWSGQQLSLVASSLGQFALVWWVTASTGSATVLATATIFAMVPQIVLGPFTGALADRWNRRKVMIVADGFVALLAAVLAVLFWFDAVQLWHIYVIMLGRSVGACFHWPAMTASTSLMVPKRHLARLAG
ncbi:MAG: MFS transporter, partial [Planctomycetota bacterium]